MSDIEEVWKPFSGYGDCYSVSNRGNVMRTSPRNIKRLLTGSRAKPFVPSGIRAYVNRGGYLQVRIGPTGHQKTVCVHSLVARAFVANPQGLREVNHIDGSKLNNCPENLEWATRSSNLRHAVNTGLLVHGLGEAANSSKLTEIQVSAIRKDLRLQRIVAEDYGISQTCVSAIRRRETWAHL
jgi:hypothetical protein